jgi:hypothetical protein
MVLPFFHWKYYYHVSKLNLLFFSKLNLPFFYKRKLVYHVNIL